MLNSRRAMASQLHTFSGDRIQNLKKVQIKEEMDLEARNEDAEIRKEDVMQKVWIFWLHDPRKLFTAVKVYEFCVAEMMSN